jgi:uncharacterized protein (TIGR03118 family)
METTKSGGREMLPRTRNLLWTSVLFIALLSAAITGCKKYDEPSSNENVDAARMHDLNLHGYSAVNLVADVAEEYNPLHIDTNLVNAWGLAFGPTGNAWVSSTDKGVTTIYNQSGVTVLPPVAIPFQEELNGGNPTGVIFNSTSNFVIAQNGQTSKFIFVTENGTVAAWSSGTTAIQVADRSSFDAVYKGVAMATNNGANYLYATNFKGGTIDVFDNAFNYVSMSFVDPNMPSGYAPFGIENIDGKLYVTYALQLGPDNEDDQAGPGNGYVDIFNPDGSFVSRFASQGALNSPWAILYMPAMHNQNAAILVGNFGDGHINVYSMDGTLIGRLKNGNTPLEIEGLWSLEFAPNDQSDTPKIFFTAGPDDEEHGVFGVISKE